MEHFVFLEADRDLSSAIAISFDPSLVILSVLIAIFASYTAFLVTERISAYQALSQRIVWIIAGSMALGGGVWAMHFIGMLAAILPIDLSYDISITLLSFIPVFLAAMVVLFNGLSTQIASIQIIIRSIAIGSGIGLMHYIGMMAMRGDAIMRYEVSIVLLSVAAAVFLSYVSLKVKIWAEQHKTSTSVKYPRLIAAIIMGAAISAMHYIGMAAVYFFPTETSSIVNHGFSKENLAEIIGIIVSSVLALLIASVYISKRLELLNKLSISEERLSAILNNVNEAIITADIKGTITSYNRGAEEIFGYSADETIGSNIKLLIPEPIRSQHDGYLEAYAKSNSAKIIGLSRTVEALHKDNHLLTIEFTVTKIEIEGHAILTGVLRDISERVKSETELLNHREHLEDLVGARTRELQQAKDEALEATQVKSEFLANMSHELRTPLNSIIGFSGIVKDGIAGPVNSEQAKQLNMVYDSAIHLLELINDILDISKVEAGMMLVKKDDTNLYSLFENVMQLLHPQISEKQLTLNSDYSAAPLTFHTDAKLLRQVLVNLLSNAVKFTSEGGILLKSSIINDLLQIEIIDSGIGISEEGLKHIFESFKQLDAGVNRMQEGTGLGLAICREYIALLGGFLEVHSKLGEGSTFTIQLPIEPITIIEGSAIDIEPTVEHKFEPNERLILIVDDDNNARELLDSYLLQDGFKTILCADSTAAISLAKKHKPYAITLDILMPDLNGWEVLAELKRNPSTAHIPVIIVSTLDDQHLGMSLGAVNYLQKPIAREELLNTLKTFSIFGKNILLVEDHQNDALLLRNILEPAGFTIKHCENGIEALKAIDNDSPSIILLDLMMPGMSGFEVIRRLRAGTDDTANIPIIVISAKKLTDAEHTYLNENVTNVLVKGQYDRDSMLDQVRKSIRLLD